jgi:hypothetical protein
VALYFNFILYIFLFFQQCKFKQFKLSTKMSSSVKFLHDIIAFCKHKDLVPARNPSFNQPKESDLYNWIESQSKVILQTVIPNMCWGSHSGEQPRKIVSFSQMPSNPQECVLLLMLWSCWSHECHQDIMKCLEYGSMELKSHYLEWVCSLSLCIVTNLHYADFSLPRVTKLRFEGTLLIESICLRQVVSYSTGLHELFDNFFSVKKIVMSFRNELPQCKLLPIVLRKPSDVYSLSKDGNDQFILVSIVEWFKRSHIVPQLQKMLDLRAIQSLFKKIQKEMSKKESTIDTFLIEIEKHAEEAAHLLGITHPSRTARLVTFVMNADQFIKKRERNPISDEKDVLLLRSYTAILRHNISNSNAEFELKRIIEIDYLFSDDLIAEFINNKFNLDDKDWCWYLKFDLKQRKNRIQDSTPKFSTKSSLRQGSFPKTFSSQKHVTFSLSSVVNPPKKIRRKCI